MGISLLGPVLRPAAAAALALALALALGLGACGGDDEPASSADESSAPTADEPAADTIVVDEGGFTADTSTIEVGDVVLFISGDEGIYGVIVGDLDGYTVTTGRHLRRPRGHQRQHGDDLGAVAAPDPDFTVTPALR